MATTAGNIDRTFLSTVSFTNTLEQREILKDVLDIYDEEASMLDVMDWTGKAKASAQTEYFTVQNDFLYTTAAVKTAYTAGAAGAVASVVFTGNTTTSIKPVVGELVLFPNGIVGYVSAVDSATDFTATIRPVNSADVIPSLTVAQKLPFFSNAYAEGTASNPMRRSNLIKRSNKLQIFKTKTSITDIAYGSKIEVEFKGKPYYFLKQQHDAYLKHRMDILYSILFGRESASLVDAAGNAINTTRGLRDTIINAGGITSNVASAGTVALSDLSALSRLMDANRCPSEYLLWAGADFDNGFDTTITAATQFINGGINYASFGGQKEVALALGVNSIAAYGRTFHKKRLNALSHPAVSSIGGATVFSKEAYLVPAGKIKVEQGGGQVDRMQIRYLEMADGINSRFREKMLGGLAPTPTNDTDTLDIVYTSIEGLETVGNEHFVKYSI
jgi:hypothetical protein